MTTIHSPIYSHFPLRRLLTHICRAHFCHNRRRTVITSTAYHLTAPLSSRAFPTSTFPSPHSCSHFYLSSALLLTPSTHLSVPLPPPTSLRASFSHQPRHFATPLLPQPSPHRHHVYRILLTPSFFHHSLPRHQFSSLSHIRKLYRAG